MTSEAKKGGFPTWAKILIGVVVVGIIGSIALAVGMVFFFQNMVKQSQDPVAIAKTAKSIATFADPLPSGYKFSMALDIAGIKTVTVEHQSDSQMLTFMSFPKKDETSDPQALVDKLYETGIQTHQTSAKFNEVKKKGSMDVAGETMPYIVGEMQSDSGKKFQGMVGCIIPKGKSETFFVYGMQPQGKDYNLDGTEEFLKTIKGF